MGCEVTKHIGFVISAVGFDFGNQQLIHKKKKHNCMILLRYDEHDTRGNVMV